jgi:hypothetical protein
VDFKYTTGGSPVPTVTITASDATGAEPGSDTGQWTIRRSGSTNASLTVNYTVGGTATAGTDYAALGSSATIPAGSSNATLTLTPVDDTTAEGPETVIVSLTANAAYALGWPDSATVTIADDEPSLETAFVVSKVLDTWVRNDFSGWVGMKLTVGATALTVTELGRIFVSGNSSTHTVKLIRASDQVDVPNGAVAIGMAGGSAGQFKYGRLSSPVTLGAGTMYYLVSEEVSGGDYWHNFNAVTTTSAATCDSGVYFGSGYPWSLYGGPNQSYVPVDFKYTTGASQHPLIAERSNSGNWASFAARTPPKSDGKNSVDTGGLHPNGSLIAGLRNGRFQVTLIGQSGDSYVIEASDDLHVWTRMRSIRLIEPTFTIEDVSATTKPARFYRAVFSFEKAEKLKL